MTQSPTPNEAFQAAAIDWLGSSRARVFAGKRLRHHGLPHRDDDIADVIGDAQLSVVRRAKGGPVTVENVGAYCSTIIANLVKRIERPMTTPLDPEAFDPTALEPDEFEPRATGAWDRADDTTTPEPVSEPDAFINQLRLHIEAGAEPEWQKSGALTVLTALAYTECDLDGVPQPESHMANGHYWAGLWFAGKRTECFPGDGKEHPRMRQARRRAIEKIRDLVDRASLLGQGRA